VYYRSGIDFKDAPEDARSRLIAGWAACAAILTSIYLFIQGFFGQPLANNATLHHHPGALAAAVLAVIVILAGPYRFVARTVWQYGIENLLDPDAWAAQWTTAKHEIASAISLIRQRQEQEVLKILQQAGTAIPLQQLCEQVSFEASEIPSLLYGLKERNVITIEGKTDDETVKLNTVD
jgi:hypothetical protein